MEPSDLLRLGRFPVLSGPDALELALGIAEPVAMGTVREVSFRIQTSPSTVVAVRGSVMCVEEGHGRGFYDVTVGDLDGTYVRLQGYSPQETCVRGFSRIDTSMFHCVETDRPSEAVAARWTLDRAGFLLALMRCRSVSPRFTDGVFRIHLGAPRNREICLGCLSRMDGWEPFRLLGAMRVPDQGVILIQLTDRDGRVFHSVLDGEFQISWIQDGLAWRNSARLAS